MSSTPEKTKEPLSFSELMSKASASAIRGGTAGAVAMGANVACLMWMRTTVRLVVLLVLIYMFVLDVHAHMCICAYVFVFVLILFSSPVPSLRILFRSTTNTATEPPFPKPCVQFMPTVESFVSTAESFLPLFKVLSVALETRRPTREF
jgi:hypothetical protein